MVKYLSKAEKLLSLVLIGIILLTSWYLVNRFVVDNSDLIPANGGIHTEGLVGRVQYLNPVLATSSAADRDVSHLIFSGLTKFNPHTGLIEDDIATSQISNDNLTYTFEILPDAKDQKSVV